ncbi:MAG: hypothetical protein A4E52_01831 [Pelotomaculum sp. PtaB.Bin013]|nr:MAG: hypothetical protein A4E52_01831 [Pelotomaculum sp. PtaB.Bin013]
MSKCQTCQHYTYRAGVAPSLARLIGKEMPSVPTCSCDYSGVSWIRRSAEVKKPRGIKCDYKLKEMYCCDCGKLLKRHSDALLVLSSELYECKKCGNKAGDSQ